MKDQFQPSIRDRSTTVRFFRWVFSWRGLRRILILLAWTVTLIALLYGEENWRGRHAWTRYHAKLEASGAQLDWAAFISKPVPDDQNFAATPFVQSWFPRGVDWSDNYSKAASKVSDVRAKKDWGQRHFVDLGAWKMALEANRSGGTRRHSEFFATNNLDSVARGESAPAVLNGLADSEAKLAELHAASHRPFSRYPVIYDLENPWGILIPHLAKVKAVCQRLQLKACAELAAGQSENAFEDVKLMLYLADSCKEEPFLISYLVRLACFQIAIQPIWEGLAEHRWTDAQLQQLQTRLQQFSFLGDLKRPLEGERAAGILTADLLYRQKYHLSELVSDQSFGGTTANLFARMAPHGWYYQEQVNYCRLYEIQLNGTYDAARKRVFPSQIAARAHEFEGEIAGGRLGKGPSAVLHHRLLAALLLPSLIKIPLKAAMGQTAADHAALACALERYRLANGQFPEKLEALVPRFISQLPTDIFTGEPYKYRRADDGQFILYSVGWNEKDDGGVPGKTLPVGYDEQQGDWVWQYLRQSQYE